MNKKILTVAILSMCIFLAGTSAQALDMTFSYDYDGNSLPELFGTMSILATDADTLKVTITGKNGLDILGGSGQITAAGFIFAPDPLFPGVADVTTGNAASDAINWVDLANLNSLPNANNYTPPTKFDYLFAATTGSAQNNNGPGVLNGQTDIFSLDFTAYTGIDDLQTVELSELITHAGIRIQSLYEEGDFPGSLFLNDNRPPPPQIPEPGTMILLGTGLLGIGVIGRKRFLKE